MATASTRTICIVCNKTSITYVCQGCSQHFCIDHLSEHRKNLGQQLDQIGNDHDEFRQDFNEQKTNPTKHPLIKQINQWEIDSIEKIKQTADRCREILLNYSNVFIHETEKKLNDLAQQIIEMRRENEFNEIDLNHLRERLSRIQEEFVHPPNLSIQQQSTAFINKISILISPLKKDHQWKSLGLTVAGGNDHGNRLDQFYHLSGISLDENNQTIYIADCGNDRIVEWIVNETNGRIVADGNENNQLSKPTDVIIDRENNSLIIANQGNRRVMRWSRQTSSSEGQIIVSDIDCWGLAMHTDGCLYVSDYRKNEVRRWRKGETNGTIVAGGNGEGNQLNQLYFPTFIFVDDDHTLYISDYANHRVMKWMKDAKEGIVVAGGNGQGDDVTQLSFPQGVIVDQSGQIYVADLENHRVMRWCKDEQEGTIIVGGNGSGDQANQLSSPVGLSFDREGNLYVADCVNHRIQKFS